MTMTIPSPLNVARNIRPRLAADLSDAPRLAYSTSTGERYPGPTARDLRLAKGALARIQALDEAHRPKGGWFCCPECDLPEAALDELRRMEIVVMDYADACRRSGAPNLLSAL